MKNVLLIDSPLANIANIRRALEAGGASVELSSDPAAVAGADRLVLPGVGSFGAAMSWLAGNGLDAAIRSAVDAGSALLGVCLGHQLLFDSSEEGGGREGLGLLRGRVRRFRGSLPVPQIGWNCVAMAEGSPLFAGVEDGTPFYFVHSYAAEAEPEDTVGTSEYEGSYVSAVARGRVYGVQFHPEKSSAAGLKVLRNFVETA
ncbi:MAG: imidazole glycerol phosphate synthase subunit HisH [Thermoanaerobaculia bacterium]